MQVLSAAQLIKYHLYLKILKD